MATAASATQLTPQQQAAIETRDVSVALSAGAGCGKTFVLTERFLSHLQPTADADAAAQLGKLIAITFTERAAREMRDRVRRKVRERLMQAADDGLAAYWLEILRRLESAQISTIHSFCGSLLRSQAVEAGLDPRFGILEPTEAAVLTAELIDDELRRRLAAADPAMLDLTTQYDLGGVRQMIGAALRERYRVDFEYWLRATPEELTARWQDYFATEVVPLLRRELVEMQAWRDLQQLIAEVPPPHPVLAERCLVLAELMRRAVDENNLVPLCEAIFEHARIEKAGGKKDWAGLEEAKYRYKNLLTEIRKSAERIADRASFDATAARPAAVAVLQVLELTQSVAAALERRKRELARLDFDDLLLRARNLLCSPQHRRLRQRLSLGVELLLVDECQDTDPLQADLIDALCGGEIALGKLFFVGDYKQSIYRFRRADPEVFRNLRGAVPTKGRLPLTLNFRSRPAILEFVNSLFGEAFGPDFEPLAASRGQATPPPAVEFLWASASSGESGDGAAGEAGEDQLPAAAAHSDDVEPRGAETLRRIEADWIARRIKQIVDGDELMLEEKSEDGRPPTLRKVKNGDVAILFRALSNAAIYEAALERHGIKYYVVGGKAFYSQQEVFDLLNFLKALDSSCDEVALAGTLRSPFFSLRDEALLLLAQHEGGLSAGLFSASPHPALDDEQRRRVAFAARTIAELREVKNRLPIAALLGEMLARTGYDAALTAEFLGTRKLANLRKLVDLARDFDQSGIFTLTDFIAQLAENVAKQPDESPAATHAEGSDVVRLMTIHQAKGLEFPVVVVPDLNRNDPGDRNVFAYHDALGPAVRSPEEGPSGLDLFRITERIRAAEESLRVFYVATTRAADYLILSCGTSGEAKLNEWRKFLGSRFDLETGEFLGQLPAGAVAPRVRVTTKAPLTAKVEGTGGQRADWPKLVAAAIEQAGHGADYRRGTEPIAPRISARRRFSFSRLADRFELVKADGDETPLLDEAGGSNGRLDAVEFGTLVHGVLARIDLKKPNDIERLVRRQARLGIDGAAEDLRLAAEMIRRFAASPRGRAVAESRKVYRELEFVLSRPAGGRGAEGMCLEGVLDLLYQDAAGGWHVIDFKSHRVKQANLAAAGAPYEMQLLIYALAVEQILGAAPVEMAVHFLFDGAEHAVAWNDAARRRVEAEVDRAVATILRGDAAQSETTKPI